MNKIIQRLYGKDSTVTKYYESKYIFFERSRCEKKTRMFKLAHYNYLEIIVCCSYKTQSNDSFYYKSAFNISYYYPCAPIGIKLDVYTNRCFRAYIWTPSATVIAQVPISSSQILLEIQPFDVSPQKGVFKVTIL